MYFGWEVNVLVLVNTGTLIISWADCHELTLSVLTNGIKCIHHFGRPYTFAHVLRLTLC